MEVNQHRTWAEIDLGAIEHNYRVICEQAKAPVLCVVKADAYGHGAVQVAKRLEKMDAPYFAVATIPEGVELREAGIETPILILGYVDEKDMDTAVQYGITVPVYDRETAELISAAAERTGKPVTVHYKLDTGMTRLGFPSWECEQTVQDILACSKLPGLISEGIFTHFAVADVPSGEAYTELQYKRFSDVCEGLQAAGLDLPLRHCANSGATLDYPASHMDMVRAGVILYGLEPSADVLHPGDFHPVLSLRSVISHIKAVEPGSDISYGRTYTAQSRIRVATIPIGYADGYSRQLSGRGSILVHGVRCPILGKVCMDQCMIDVTAVPQAQVGDVVTLIGRDGDEEIRVDALADLLDTIHYEIVCGISKRVTRVYKKDGREDSVFDCILDQP